ncbi:MAG TPA: hypothetical protein VFI26_06255, partial [Lysobacter sp.]|nr:hypothetical protein [Lysobacter sp.]
MERVRRSLRLLPLPLLIAASLPAWADNDMPPNWSQCPVQDAVPAFPEVPSEVPSATANPATPATDSASAPIASPGIDASNAGPTPIAPNPTPQQRMELPTDIAGDQLSGVEGSDATYSGHVALTRGDQFLGTDRLVFNSETG